MLFKVKLYKLKNTFKADNPADPPNTALWFDNMAIALLFLQSKHEAIKVRNIFGTVTNDVTQVREKGVHTFVTQCLKA